MNTTDEALYAGFLAENDEEAFRLLFERYREPLTFFLRELLGNPDDAEELMMDSFAAVISGTARYKGTNGASFRTFLYAVAGNKARVFLRKNKRKSKMPPEEELAEAQTELPEYVFLREERYRMLYRALSDLPEEERMVLYLKYFEEMKTEEIGKIMKKTARQIYKLTERGKGRLRDLLWDI